MKLLGASLNLFREGSDPIPEFQEVCYLRVVAEGKAIFVVKLGNDVGRFVGEQI